MSLRRIAVQRLIRYGWFVAWCLCYAIILNKSTQLVYLALEKLLLVDEYVFEACLPILEKLTSFGVISDQNNIMCRRKIEHFILR